MDSAEKLREYNMLNTITPPYFKTKYPYNIINPEKIIFTSNKITILAKDMASMEKKSKTKGGDESQKFNKIVFY